MRFNFHTLRIAAPLAALSLSACSGGSSGSMPSVGSAPVITSFTASPSWLTTGQSGKLSWSVTGATTLSVSGIGVVNGQNVTVTPTADTTYVLTASNMSGATTANLTLTVFPPPTVWFAPLGATQFIPVQGAADYFDLFTPTAPWGNAAAHVTVFKMYTQMVNVDDATLRNMFADLKRRHIAFALEFGPLEPEGTCGLGIEGFEGAGGLSTAQRIHDLGGNLQYIAFDEPLDGATLYAGPNQCLWTPAKVAQVAAAHVAQIRTVFPDVIVGDIEELPNGAPDWLSAYQQWMDAWQATTGKAFAFFHLDVDWDSQWQPAVTALARAVRMRNIPVGQIYIGTGAAGSDAEWVASAQQRMSDYETHGTALPDQVIFQSWEPYPKTLLPETDPTTFTHLIDLYYRTRTSLSASINVGSTQGTLMIPETGNPVAGATVAVTAVPMTGTGQQTTYTTTGTIPPGTQYVTFGVRAGTECDWPLPASFSVSSFVLDAGAAGSIGADFSNQLSGWGYSGAPSLIQVSNGNLQVVANPGESLNLNHDAIAFSAAGAPYTFSVTATIPAGSFGNACVAAIFQDATVTEFVRTVISLRPQLISVGSVQTGADGSYSASLGSLPPINLQLWSDYAGSDTLWPAAAGLAVGNAPALSITTTSLPSGAAGTAYSQVLVATNGVLPYLWVGTGLPPGLILHQDGTVNGTPTTAGSYTVSASVIDSSAPAQVMDLSLPLVVH